MPESALLRASLGLRSCELWEWQQQQQRHFAKGHRPVERRSTGAGPVGKLGGRAAEEDCPCGKGAHATFPKSCWRIDTLKRVVAVSNRVPTDFNLGADRACL